MYDSRASTEHLPPANLVRTAALVASVDDEGPAVTVVVDAIEYVVSSTLSTDTLTTVVTRVTVGLVSAVMLDTVLDPDMVVVEERLDVPACPVTGEVAVVAVECERLDPLTEDADIGLTVKEVSVSETEAVNAEDVDVAIEPSVVDSDAAALDAAMADCVAMH